MSKLHCTLLSDGRSDCVLLPIIKWLLKEYFKGYPIDLKWADLSLLPRPPKSFPERIEKSLDLYPCDVLFIHRDAEKETLKKRQKEILDAIQEIKTTLPYVCVIPIRMSEAWLLFDESAFR